MKNSKWMRFLLIVVSVAMVLSLFACGDKRGNEGETTTAAPEGTTAAPENTTVAGGETTTVAGGETTTVAGGETTTVAGGETTVAGGEDTTVAGGEDTTVAGGEDTTVAGGEDTTVAGGEDTTVAPDDVYAGNWHASIDVFLADVDGNLGDNVLAGDFSAVDTVIANANTNNHRGTTIIDVANVEYPSVNASCVFFGVGWIAVDGYDVENFVCNVYDADGNVLKTVALGLTDAEIGVVEHVSNNMNYAAGTVAHRLTVNLEAELIDLSDYDGQTVKVVYSIDVATTEYTIDLIEIEVVVPEAPAGEDTTVDGGEDTTVAGGEDTTVAGGEDTTVAGGEDTTVAGGEDTTVAGGEDTTVAGGEDTTVAPGPELGSEENPIEVMFTMNDEYTEGTATVTVPAGATYYFQSYGIGGMNLTINDGTPTPLSGNPRMPVVFSITNEGEAEAEYALAVSYPVGSMSNPAQLVIGENTAAIEAGNTQGYYFTYTAEAAGTLTLTISSEAGWTYVVNNMTSYVYGDIQCSDSDPVVNPAVVTVAAGDVIEIIVNTYDPADMWSNPAGTVTVTAAVAAPEFEGNWHAAVDAFYYCTAPDFSDAVQIAGACTNKTVGNNISTAGSFLTSVVANFVYYEAGWIGFADHGVENFLFTVYDADGNVLKTVELALRDGEPGLSEAVQGIIGGNENTIVPRLGNDSEIIDLSEFAGQTVTVVYSADVAGTDFTVDVISLVVEVPAAQ